MLQWLISMILIPDIRWRRSLWTIVEAEDREEAWKERIDSMTDNTKQQPTNILRRLPQLGQKI